MNLSKHIAELLKYHECVIIPEFGGFISNYQPAQFDTVRNTFSPPSKEVIFNSKISKNDGLLINHLVETEKLGYHQAETLVMNFVDQTFSTLNKGEKVAFENMGSFEYDRNGTLVFQAQNKFDLLQAYGLTEFSYPTLFETKSVSKFQPRPAVRALNNKKDLIKIAASIALVLSLSLFPVKTEKGNLHSSMLNPMELLMEESPVSKQVDAVAEAPVTMPETNTELTRERSPYILVGGCFQSFENASQFKNELVLSGHHSELVKLDNGFYRIIIDAYSNKDEALEAMATYRQNHQGSGVWVSIR